MSFPVFPATSDLIAWWARVTPDRVAIVDRARDTRHTYGALDDRAERWARLLIGFGVARGDRVATLAGNRVDIIALYFGAARVGATLVPLNWRLAALELSRVVDDAAPIIVVGEGRFQALGEAAMAGLQPAVRWIDVDADAPALLDRVDRGSPLHVAAVDPHAAAMLLYTSGSTGKPKGAMLPHRQVYFNAVATTIGWQLGPDDIALVSSPFFHTGGWHVFAMPLLQRGGTVVLFDQFEPTAFLDAIVDEGVTVTFGVPTQLTMLTQAASWGRPMPSLRFLISGGAPCPKALGDRIRQAGIRFREGYGLTECGPNCFAITDEEAIRRPGFVGWPMPFLEMQLSGIANGEMGIDEPGELLLRGPQMFGGYFNDPVRTAEAVDGDGWLHTGDLAVRDADGAYRICGRKKDMYISGGENVFPGEVEAALSECPGVAEVVVVGVPDEKWGEVGRAFVLPRVGESVTTDDVIAHARRRLAGYKVPKSVVVMDDLPRLGSGKPDRKTLMTMPAAALAATR